MIRWLAVLLAMGGVGVGITPAPSRAQDPIFRSGVELVNVGVTVTDGDGNLISVLNADDFEVYEDGVRQTVQLFAAGHTVPPGDELHLGLLLDVSQSMERDIEFTRTASIRFLNTLTGATDITIVDFDTEVRVTRFTQRDFPRLVERIRTQDVGGRTALYDAIGVYLDGASEQQGRKVMLLYTDGGDTRSAMNLREVLDLLKASDVTVYAIGAIAGHQPAVRMSLQSILRQIAETSGGQALFPRSVRELDRMYRRVIAEIRAQYTLGYLSTNHKSDGTWREIEIKLNGEDLRGFRVRARDGYFALYKP